MLKLPYARQTDGRHGFIEDLYVYEMGGTLVVF